ncbi:MAG TPA: AAC(3) family N-acetyltransferase [Gemmataceae bacterium]|nr:AAC(3) family N-acetyltransferase [Gemmataceae bacterium]
MGMKSFFKRRLSPRNYERLAIVGRALRDLRNSFRAAPALSTSRLGSADATGVAPLGLNAIRAAIASLGIGAGDLLLVHSSANTLFEAGKAAEPDTPGDLLGYSDAIVDLLFDIIGPTGTLLMPTEPPGDVILKSRTREVFDYRKTPTNRGLITELFRRRPEVVRSVHPRYNLAACGPLADELVRDHHLSVPYCMDENSPWYKFTQREGKVLMLGPTLDANSLIHLPEYLYPTSYPRAVYYNKTFPLRYIDRDGVERSMEQAIHVPHFIGGECAQFCKYLQEKYHLYRFVAAGYAELICYNAKAQFDALCDEMREDVCWNDVRYWPKSA